MMDRLFVFHDQYSHLAEMMQMGYLNERAKIITVGIW